MIQFLRGTSEAVQRNNPTLAAGQPLYELDTNKLKVGDGSTPYANLPYLVGDSGIAQIVTWGDIQNKPSEYPPESHTHTVSQITDLDLSEITTDIENLQHNQSNLITTSGETVDRVNTLEQQMSNKANTNHTHSISQVSGLQSQLNSIDSTASSAYSYAYPLRNSGGYIVTDDIAHTSFYGIVFNCGLCICSGIMPINNMSITTALGNMFRSNAPYLQRDYPYPYEFSTNPSVQMTFISSNNNSALVWPNPTFSYIRTHLPQCYLVRPTSTTGVTGYISAFVSGYVADLAENM